MYAKCWINPSCKRAIARAGALERRIEPRVDWTQVADIGRLGLAEIALNKGQGNYVTLVTGQFREGKIVILGVLPGHEKVVWSIFYA